MKKFIALLLGVFVALPASATLWQYYSEQGLNLPSVQQRAPLASDCGISNYTGTVEQNIKLEACLRGPGHLGGTPTPTSSASIKYVEVTDATLYSGAIVGDTTITLDSLKDIYNNSLTMTDFGDLGFGRINPEGDNISESFTFTGITTNSDGTKTLTGVKTVLAKYPYTQTSGLIRAHGIGSTVRISNTAAFYDTFANKENNEIIEGDWKYNAFPYIATSTALPDANGEFATKYYVDTVGAGGFTAANVSTTLGLQALGTSPETVGINASSTGGLNYDSSGRLKIKYGTNSGVGTDTNGLFVERSDNFAWTGTHTWGGASMTTTASANNIPQATVSGTISQSWIATSTNNGDFLRSTSTGAYWGGLVSISVTSTMLQSKAAGTTYQNTSTKSLLVIIEGSTGADNDSSADLSFYLDTTSSVLNKIGQQSHSSAQTTGGSISSVTTFIVPPNWYYKVIATVSGTGASASITRWNEMPL